MGCLILREDGTILSANETAKSWLGYTTEELLGHPLHMILGGGGQFFLQSQIFPMLRLKGLLEEIYLKLKGREGGLTPALVNLALIKSEGGNVIEFSFMRIPQRGHLEDELLQAKKLAEQASDSKTKFLGMMSHELRSPLGAISLNNQMLLDGELGVMPPDQREAIASSESCVQSVTVLVDDILSFAQMRSGSVQVTLKLLPLAEAVARAERTIRHRFYLAGITCSCASTDTEIKARYDPDRLQQILLNLLNNALKFTPKDGRVSLKIFSESEWVGIDVSDSGCGIPSDQLRRIFEPFVQLSSSIETTEKKGVGLGLAICHDLAAAMAGTIRVRSEVGKGSTFSVFLPRAYS